MLEGLLTSVLISQVNYFYLTAMNKVAVERQIVDNSSRSDFQIAPRTISGILGLDPQCSKSPRQAQIQCTWIEGRREITAYWSEPWKFQRWESRGF